MRPCNVHGSRYYGDKHNLAVIFLKYSHSLMHDRIWILRVLRFVKNVDIAFEICSIAQKSVNF